MPSVEEIAEALHILGMSPDDVRCAFCGNLSTEWDHLRPLVLKQRPTGYISEIANLVRLVVRAQATMVGIREALKMSS